MVSTVVYIVYLVLCAAIGWYSGRLYVYRGWRPALKFWFVTFLCLSIFYRFMTWILK